MKEAGTRFYIGAWGSFVIANIYFAGGRVWPSFGWVAWAFVLLGASVWADSGGARHRDRG